MPLFSRSSFRTPKKPPRRKADSVPNLSTLGLDDTLNFTAESVRGEGGGPPPVSMKLDGYDICFEDGQWVVGKKIMRVMTLILNKAHHSSNSK